MNIKNIQDEEELLLVKEQIKALQKKRKRIYDRIQLRKYREK